MVCQTGEPTINALDLPAHRDMKAQIITQSYNDTSTLQTYSNNMLKELAEENIINYNKSQLITQARQTSLVMTVILATIFKTVSFSL